MKRIVIIMSCIFGVAFACWLTVSISTHSGFGKRSTSSRPSTLRVGSTVLPGTLPEATQPGELKNPKKFVRDRFRGGIGTLLVTRDGEIVVIGVLDGSPAEKAGIRNEDVIIAVDGIATKGRALGTIAEGFDGFVGTDVLVDLKRPDGTAIRTSVVREPWRRLETLPATIR